MVVRFGTVKLEDADVVWEEMVEGGINKFLAEITLLATEEMRRFGVEAKVALVDLLAEHGFEVL